MTPDEGHPRLASCLAALRARLDAFAEGAVERAPPAPAHEELPASLAHLADAFGLTPFERNVVLLAAGVELDGGFAAACARAQGDAARPCATFALALATLPDPHWSALTPASPLRRWRIVEPAPGEALVTAPLRIDERALHHVAGVIEIDARIGAVASKVLDEGPLPPSQEAVAARAADEWRRAGGREPLPVVQLAGRNGADKRALAARAAASLGAPLFAIAAEDLVSAPADAETFARAWDRESTLSGSVLLVEADEIDAADLVRAGPVARLADRTSAPLLLAVRDPLRLRERRSVVLDVEKPSAHEQRDAWRAALGPHAEALAPRVDALVAQFDLSTFDIRRAARSLPAAAPSGAAEAGALLWEACRSRARARLDDLAQRIDCRAGWDDLVLPEAHKRLLRSLLSQARHRLLVHDGWGFADASSRGLGVSALFAGESGTGKTMAAEVLAREMGLDLYRVDLSQVVSKYIGETEKNVRRVFDAAEGGAALLLFDEADALFGKRSEVKDSHDRHANVEVSYLLQRMESYRGVCVLTTNLKDHLDTAFLRRLRFIVHFPFPDAEARAEIWRRAFARAPTEGIDTRKLARLGVAGGNIRNIALNAAFLAAEEGAPVRMAHVLASAHREFAKLERPVPASEVQGWVP